MADDTPREFSFAHAPKVQPQIWTIREGHVMRRGGAHALKLADIRSAHWDEVSYRGTRSAWLTLKSPNQALKIECAEAGESRSEFLALVYAISEGLQAVNPNLLIGVDTGGPWRWAAFGMSVILAGLGVFGLYDEVLAAADTVNYGLAILISAGVGVAAYFAWYLSPWRPRTSLSPRAFGDMLREAYGAAMPGPQDDAAER